jgi:uncharacterized OB-fold protein
MSLFRRNRSAREESAEPGADAFAAAEPDAAPAVAPAPKAPTAVHPGPAELDALVGDTPSTRRRGRLRRRLRHLRRVREVLLRDLGGLTFELHRTGSTDGGPVLDGKLARLANVDAEIRDLEDRLSDHRAMIIREPGIGGTCAECGELFGSEARYCWACGSPVASGAGGAPHLAAWTTHPQLTRSTTPEPAHLEAPTVDAVWVDHHAEHAPEDPPPAPVPQMDPEQMPAPEPPAPNEPATGDVGGEAGEATGGADWLPHEEPGTPPLSSGDPLAPPQDYACPRCGAPLRPDQDWCLQCGAAVTTHVAGAPGWRTPVAIVGVVLLLAAAGLLVAFLELSDDADRVARAPSSTPAAIEVDTPTPTPTASPTATPSPTPTASPSATPTPSSGVPPLPSATPGKTPTPSASPSTTPPATTGTVASWPAGKSAWTVILKSASSKAEADKRAKELQAQGKSVGVLNSSDYSSLRADYWVVFSGQYEKRSDAQTAADGFKSTVPEAYARFVKP